MITVAGLIPGQRATVEGRVREVEDINERRRTVRRIVLGDDTGDLAVTFRPGHGGADIQPGQVLRISGKARQAGNRPVTMVDPDYQVLQQPQETHDAGGSGEAGETG